MFLSDCKVSQWLVSVLQMSHWVSFCGVVKQLLTDSSNSSTSQTLICLSQQQIKPTIYVPSCIHQKLVNLHVKCERKSFETSAATQYSCHVCLTKTIVNLSNPGEGKGVPALNWYLHFKIRLHGKHRALLHTWSTCAAHRFFLHLIITTTPA